MHPEEGSASGLQRVSLAAERAHSVRGVCRRARRTSCCRAQKIRKERAHSPAMLPGSRIEAEAEQPAEGAGFTSGSGSGAAGAGWQLLSTLSQTCPEAHWLSARHGSFSRRTQTCLIGSQSRSDEHDASSVQGAGERTQSWATESQSIPDSQCASLVQGRGGWHAPLWQIRPTGH